VHAAEANVEPSIHLTLGIHPPTMLALVTKALEAFGYKDDRVLARLPPRYAKNLSVRAKLRDAVREVVDLIDENSIGDAIAALEDSLVRRGRCVVAGQLVENSFEAAHIGQQTELAKSRPLYARVLAIDGGVGLQFGESMVTAGDNHRAAMLFLANVSQPFRVGDIPGLPRQQQIELARKLVIDGFLIRTPAQPLAEKIA
jgi:hypothetical protein